VTSASSHGGGSYRVYGMSQSYFTRKLTGYLDYKRIPYLFRRYVGMGGKPTEAGFPGGIPAVGTPAGEFMWDTTPLLHHLDARSGEPSIFPADSVQRFLAYLIEDASDEWIYRVAMGSRWCFVENHSVGGYELGRDLAAHTSLTVDQAYELVGAHVRSTLAPLGITPENAPRWMNEVLRPWQRSLGAHLESRSFVFGERASLADFALFGGCAAHFANDPLCRRWLEADAPALVRHTHRLFEPEELALGAWEDWSEARGEAAASRVPETMVALLRELGRTYLPWVSRACVDGAAEATFSDGSRVSIAASAFLRAARGVLHARYVALRDERLDALLARAGVLHYFAEFTAYASAVPDPRVPPRPSENRPFAPAN